MKKAFSLIELSIVLVILGLLTGGILAGQSLIRAAELRSVSTEYQRYLTASQAFRDKYFAIPGDMSNATAFWGRLNSNADCVTNSSAAVASPGACDGNSDGILSVASAASKAGEFVQYWRQLANAGLIEGSYSGLAGSGGSQHCVIGTDCPISKLANSGWGVLYSPPGYAGNTVTYALNYGNYLQFGAQIASSLPGAQALKPEEAWNIDTKLDDGKPAYGKVIANYWNNSCAVPDDGATFTNTNFAASYKLTSSTIACGLMFRNAF